MNSLSFTLSRLGLAVTTIGQVAGTIAAISAVETVRPIIVKVELSEAARKKMQATGASLQLWAEAADEIGPGGDYAGSSVYELFKPGKISYFSVSIPVTENPHASRNDDEININVGTGNRARKENFLNCGLIQDRKSVLYKKSNVIFCDLFERKPK